MSIENTRGGYFLHFSTIEANLFGRFEGLERNNNNSPSGNNNNNNLPLLPSLGFRENLEGRFNSSLRGNPGGLDPNVAALVNALTRINLRINYVEKESNHVKLTKFERIEE